MGTHNESYKAEPQNEFLSGFKIKNKDEQSYVNDNQKSGGDFITQNNRAGSQNTSGLNPSQLTQQPDKDANLEQSGNDLFETGTAPGFLLKLKGKLVRKKSGSGETRQKVMVVMIPVLFVIMVFMFRHVLSKSPQKSQGAPADEKVITAVNESSNNEINWKIPDPLQVKRKDKIKIVESTKENAAGETNTGGQEYGIMNVRGILFSEDKPSVVIGNQIVHLNQKINDVTVVEIHMDYIVFEKDGNRWTQKISDETSRMKNDAYVPETPHTNKAGNSDNDLR